MVKIAYLILCHTDPAHIARLSRKVTTGTENQVFIHTDAKANENEFKDALNGYPQAHFIEDRVSVHWGGFSSVVATINLMEAALKAGKFDRYVLLQGLDYPIKSNQEIDAFFMEHKDTEFLLAQNISQSHNWHEIHKYYLRWDLDNRTFFNTVLRKFNALILKTHHIPHFHKNYVEDRDGNRMDIHQGCAQFGLTEDAVRYILDFYHNNEQFNRRFTSIYTPDELYFHTILYNSKFIDRTPWGRAEEKPALGYFENLTYFEYPVTVTLFTDPADWPKLKETGFLYFRKASSESKKLLDLIDQEHGYA